MKKIIFLLLLLSATPAHAELNVFACEPEWKLLAEQIGKENITAFSATTPLQDPHHIRAKPSLLANMRKANLVICSGAGLEGGWLPLLLQKSSSSSTNILMASDYVNVIGKHAKLDRSEGDVHPEGNPHIHLDPNNILKVGKELAKRFGQLDPANQNSYQQNWQEFEKVFTANIKKWEKDGASLKGSPYIVHHNSWAYLFNWLGLKQAAALEPKPGIPPTTGHLESLLSVKAAAIIRAPFNPADASIWLSEKTGIPAAELPFTSDKSLTELFETIITELENAKR